MRSLLTARWQQHLCRMAVTSHTLGANSSREENMDFVSTRIITDDIHGLVQFYERLGLKATWLGDEFAELETPSCKLAIGTTRTMQQFFAGAAVAASNRSVIIEFRVEDADAEYKKLQAMGAHVEQAPITQPWGNRSLLFRDPDGNLINFFTPVSREATQRFARK
ncbi:VOC family protein [Caballeronia sp. LZ065]|uniref:VOC family protein n=1 Tax=Caballeronia sp. LZ065 TaxID=3038571 RepID=UPI002859899B|nr:VOC family protein [Caballeronia sp. LZ065]MDR5781383.1 VOC family protein [Caballeronia sp. LZ065]